MLKNGIIFHFVVEDCRITFIYLPFFASLPLCRIQTERQERKRVKEELGIAEEPGRKTRFDPPEPVASGISLGIKPLPAGSLPVARRIL